MVGLNPRRPTRERWACSCRLSHARSLPNYLLCRRPLGLQSGSQPPSLSPSFLSFPGFPCCCEVIAVGERRVHTSCTPASRAAPEVANNRKCLLNPQGLPDRYYQYDSPSTVTRTVHRSCCCRMGRGGPGQITSFSAAQYEAPLTCSRIFPNDSGDLPCDPFSASCTWRS